MAAATMVIAFSQIFWEAGMGKALIQRQTDIQAAANAAFLINIGLGLVIAALLYSFAQPIALFFFQDERVTAVLQVMTLQVLLGALGSVQTALLQKEMRFKKLFWVRFATIGMPGLASIPLAWNGWGYWALVVGALAGQGLQTLLLWTISDWRPTGKLEWRVTREINIFGLWVALSGLFSWVFSWADVLLLGKYFGLHEVGVFRLGNQIAVLAHGTLFSFMGPVLYSWFSKGFNMNRDLAIHRLNSVFSVIAVVSLPIGLFIYGISIPFEQLVLGETWIGTGLVIGLIAIKEAVLWVFAFNVDAVRAAGLPRLETVVTGLSGLANILVLYAYSHGSFELFVFGRAIPLAFCGLIIHLSIYLYVFGENNLTYRKLLSYIAAYFALFWLITIVEKAVKSDSIAPLVITGLALLFFAALFFLNRLELSKLFQEVRGRSWIGSR